MASKIESLAGVEKAPVRPAAAATSGLSAAELLVFEEPSCGPCILFEREVAAMYSNTVEGRRAPMRKQLLGSPLPESLAFVAPVGLAPTFVLIHCGREVGRFQGYSSQELFWMSLAYLMQKLPE